MSPAMKISTLTLSFLSAASAFTSQQTVSLQHSKLAYSPLAQRTPHSQRVASNVVQAKLGERERTIPLPDFSKIGDAVSGNDKQKKTGKPGSSPPAPFLNQRLFAQLIFSQLAIFGFAYFQTNGATLGTFIQYSHFDSPVAIALGAAASLPLIRLSRFLQQSDAEAFASINLSTELLAYSLFGKNTQPAFALFVSAIMCTITGVVEETIFRGQVMPNVVQGLGVNGWITDPHVGIPAAGVLSSILFALGHLNIGGGFRYLVSPEARALFTLQFLNGLNFAILFGLTGDLTAPIVAHALYDLSALYGTHLRVTKQLSYAEEQAGGRPKTPMDAARRVFYLMDRNRDGFVSPRELRIGLYSFGIFAPTGFSDKVFKKVDRDGDGLIDAKEFEKTLESSVGPNQSAEAAAANTIKRSVLGVQM